MHQPGMQMGPRRDGGGRGRRTPGRAAPPQRAGLPPLSIPLDIPPTFQPRQPVQTFAPVIRPVVDITPSQALAAMLTTGVAMTGLGHLMTMGNVGGALAGQLRGLGFFTGGVGGPITGLLPPAPLATGGTIPMPVTGALGPMSPRIQAIEPFFGGLLTGFAPMRLPTPPPFRAPGFQPFIGPVRPMPLR